MWKLYHKHYFHQSCNISELCLQFGLMVKKHQILRFSPLYIYGVLPHHELFKTPVVVITCLIFITSSIWDFYVMYFSYLKKVWTTLIFITLIAFIIFSVVWITTHLTVNKNTQKNFQIRRTHKGFLHYEFVDIPHKL